MTWILTEIEGEIIEENELDHDDAEDP